MATAQAAGEPARSPAADRILVAASRLFYERGIRAVGVDTIAAEAAVTKVTLYKHFGSKDGLVAAHLRSRDETWQQLWTDAIERHATAEARLLAVFDAYEEWLVADSFRGCAFINATAEIAEPEHPARVVTREHKSEFARRLAALASEAGFDRPERVADDLLLLLEGATAAAAVRQGVEPLQRARTLATQLLRLPG